MTISEQQYQESRQRIDNNFTYFHPQKYLEDHGIKVYVILTNYMKFLSKIPIGQRNRIEHNLLIYRRYIDPRHQVNLMVLVYLYQHDYFSVKNREYQNYVHDNKIINRYQNQRKQAKTRFQNPRKASCHIRDINRKRGKRIQMEVIK